MNREEEIREHYGYDPMTGEGVTYDNGERASDTVYSDRLYQWDHKKYNSLCKKYWKNEGQSFSGRNPEDIEKFLSEYIGSEIILCKIWRLTNKSNGYPYWRFDYLKITT